MKPFDGRNIRVVITGLGAITPIGIGKEEFWEAAIHGQSGVAKIRSFDCSLFKSQRGCEVKNFNYENYSVPNGNIAMGRGSQFGLAAAKMALDDAGLSTDEIDAKSIGVSIGTTGGEIQILENIVNSLAADPDRDKLDKGLFPLFPCNVIPGNIARAFRIRGPHFFFPNACAAGNYAISYASDLIRMGKARIMIAGGVDPFSRMAFTGFCRLNTVSAGVCRAFDKNRKGLILGEGAGMIVLESHEQAIKRKARIYAELLGYGVSCDSFHVTSPNPDGSGMIAAMRRALDDAGLTPGDVDYISAHGTGTIINDKVETLAIRTLFKEHAEKLMVSSIKGMIGHTMGAASAIEAVICTLAAYENIVPPTIHYETKDPECDLDYVPNAMRKAVVNIAMSNAFAFGGNNTSLIIGKYEG
ncbi:MAG: beta-ketoacyl-[acyl-carrier-protein] synthase family protein [Desulfobacteraceae bacterium]|nr:MAG: beta-ketoacyl-[acyl-carrier-protein] synthase family protein [Desulfobacteraceae bacterium]